MSHPAGAGLDEAGLSETQERFLRDAARRLPLERVVELHVFPPIRQGGTETGIAVVAVEPAHAPAPPHGEDDGSDASSPYRNDASASDVAPSETPAPGDGQGEPSQDVPLSPSPARRRVAERLTVFSARYRLTLKGPDRGRWEVEVVEEADAPLVSVDAVVRGVQRRAGEGAAAERLSAEQLRAIVGESASSSGAE